MDFDDTADDAAGKDDGSTFGDAVVAAFAHNDLAPPGALVAADHTRDFVAEFALIGDVQDAFQAADFPLSVS